MASIHALPSELLIEIFHYYTAMVIFVYENSLMHYTVKTSDSPRPYSWLKIGHICQLWRNIVLAVPELSSSIIAYRHAGVEEMLRRSRSVPLRLLSGPQLEETEDSLKAYSLAFSHFHRFIDVNLVVNDGLLALLCQQDTVQTDGASALERLNLSLVVTNSDTPPALPLLADTSFPALRHFTLQGGNLDLCEPMLSWNLRHLSLSCLDYPFTGQELAMYLQDMENLRTLVIQEALWEDPADLLDPDTWAPDQTATLPKLRRLSVDHLHPGHVCRLLAHIVYPATAQVAVKTAFASSDTPPGIVAKMFAPKPPGIALPVPTPAFQCVTVEAEGDTGARIRVCLLHMPADRQSTRPKWLPLVDLVARSSQDVEAAAGTLDQLSLSSVTELRVSSAELSTCAWAALFRALPGLQALLVKREGPVQTLPSALPRQGLPHLKSIDYDLSWSVMPIEPFGNLAEALALRNGHENRLEKLTVVLSSKHLPAVKEEIEDSSFGVVHTIRVARTRAERLV